MGNYYEKSYNIALVRCKKSTGVFMCKKLNELKGMSAEHILEKSKQISSVPIDLEKILETLQINKYSDTFTRLEEIENKGHIAGLVLLNGDNVGIFYNQYDSIIQKRFTIAHEIGHCCLHGDILTKGYVEFLHKDGFENKHEEEASIFAAHLLIPEKSLNTIYHKLLLPSLDGLADIFEVPHHIMKFRLKELKMRYYIPLKNEFVEP